MSSTQDDAEVRKVVSADGSTVPPPLASASRAGGGATEPKPARVTIASADPDVIAEIRGFALFLSRTRGRDGLKTIGQMFNAALMGKGNLPAWREKYNEGSQFALVRDDRLAEDDRLHRQL